MASEGMIFEYFSFMEMHANKENKIFYYAISLYTIIVLLVMIKLYLPIQ